jgi:hypothetical protein
MIIEVQGRFYGTARTYNHKVTDGKPQLINE